MQSTGLVNLETLGVKPTCEVMEEGPSVFDQDTSGDPDIIVLPM